MDVAGGQMAFRGRGWAFRLLVIGGAVVAGLALQQVLRTRLDAIQDLAKTDVLTARAQLAHLLQVVGGLVFGLTTALGVTMVLGARRALALEIFPPPGVLSWGSAHVATGEQARWRARIATVLAAAVIACSLIGLGMMLYMAQRLLACRA
jgi:hypothetical protein